MAGIVHNPVTVTSEWAKAVDQLNVQGSIEAGRTRGIDLTELAPAGAPADLGVERTGCALRELAIDCQRAARADCERARVAEVAHGREIPAVEDAENPRV